MCIRTMREMGPAFARPFNVAVGQADTAILPADSNRVAIILNSDSATATWLNFFGPGATTRGLPIVLAGGYHEFHKERLGQIVTQALRAFADGAANINIGGYEIILPDDGRKAVMEN